MASVKDVSDLQGMPDKVGITQPRRSRSRSGHVVPSIVLLGMAAFATWNAVNNGDWTDPVVLVVGVLAVTWFGAGLGLLTGTSVGVWLGRLGAATLLLFAVYIGWGNIIDYGGPESWRTTAIMIAAALTTLLVGAGVGILVALRPGRDGRPKAGER